MSFTGICASNQSLSVIMKGDSNDQGEIAVVPTAFPVTGTDVPSGAAAPANVQRKVNLVAPVAMAAGYQFRVDADNNQSLLVEVVRACVRALDGVDSWEQ
jgi:hypothetical protein